MPSRVAGFVIECKLYIRNKLVGATVEAQVQWVLSYMQGGSVDVWKENVMEELEAGKVEYELVEEFLSSLKKRIWRERERISESSRIEEAGARGENNGGICAGVQEGNKGK